MGSDFVFHIRNAHPADMVAVLATLAENPNLEAIIDIVSEADSLGYSIRDRQRLEALMTARDLGLVSPDRNDLLPAGRLLVELETRNPDLFIDAVHGLQYSLWEKKASAKHCFSWTYRLICEHLWSSGTRELIDIRRNMASEIEGQARQFFEISDVVISPKSVGGALLWLNELRPEVIDGGQEWFKRRVFCSPELFVMGANFVYCEKELDYGSNLLLGEECRDDICRFCLLDPAGFERVLDYAVAQFDFLDTGLGGGWGRFLTLHRAPCLEDFV